MAEDARRHLKTLGLEPGANAAEIKQAYRELAHIWHPDRFANAPQLRDVAQAKMAEINTAYQFLKHAIPEPGAASSGASAASPASPHTQNKRRADYAAPSSQPNPSPPSADTSRAAHNAASARREARQSGASASHNSQVPNVPLLPIAHVMHDPTQAVTDVAFSLDGRGILAASGASMFWWEVGTGEKQRELRMEKGDCPCLAVAPGGRSVIAANNVTGWPGRRWSELRLCDLQTGNEQKRWKQSGHITSLAFSYDGKQIAAGDTNGVVRFWEADSEREIQHLPAPEDAPDAQVRRVAYVRGDYAAKQVVVLRTGQTLTEIGLWEVRRIRLLKAYNLHVRECLTYGQIGDALPSPDGSLLLVANNDPGRRNYSLHLWELKTGSEVRAFHGHTDDICGLAWSADGQRIASCGEDKTVRVWNVATGIEIALGLGHARTVRTVAFAPDSKMLASGGDDRAVCLWRLPV